MVFDSVLVSVGKIKYLFGISLIVNIGYYGIVYSLFLAGFFEASISFIILMFGFGMIVHIVFSVLFYMHSKRNPENGFNGSPVRYLPSVSQKCLMRKKLTVWENTK